MVREEWWQDRAIGCFHQAPVRGVLGVYRIREKHYPYLGLKDHT